MTEATPQALEPTARSDVWSRLATERGLFTGAVTVVGLHVVDDSFLQPEPGMSPVDHLPSGLARSRWSSPPPGRTRACGRGRVRRSRSCFGFFGVLAGIEAVYYTFADRPSGDDFTGFLSLAGRFRPARDRDPDALADAGVPMTAAAAATCAAASFFAGVVVLIPTFLMPVSIGYFATHIRAGSRPDPESRRGARGRQLHDERRAAARGLVHPVEERRHRDRFPRPLRPAEAHAHAREARLRRPPLRPPRRRRERRRPEHLRLGRRPRPARGDRVPPQPP